MSVTLASKAKRPLTLHLPHDQYCSGRGVCSCVRMKSSDPQIIARHPAALHLSAGEVIGGLPDEVLRCSEVKAAIKSGLVVVVPNARAVEAGQPQKQQNVPAKPKAEAPKAPPAQPARKEA